MFKIIAFDLDGTLTEHRSKLEFENKSLLDALSKKYKQNLQRNLGNVTNHH